MLVWAFYIVDQNARQRQPTANLRKVPPIRDNGGMFKGGRGTVKPARSFADIAAEFAPAYQHVPVAAGHTRPSVKDDFAL